MCRSDALSFEERPEWRRRRADLGNAVLDAANADAANELVVVNRGDQHLEGSLGITCNKYGMVMSFTGIRLFHH